MPTCCETSDPCIVCWRRHGRASPYCSIGCERYSERERRRVAAEQAHWRTCPECLTEFRATRGDSIYCSGRCRTKAYRARRGLRGVPPEIEGGV